VLELLSEQIFIYMIVFSRIGAFLMVIPGIGDRTVPSRIRLFLAVIIAITVGISLADVAPPIPSSPLKLLGIIGSEVLIGLFLGTLIRLAFSALHVAGTIISFQTSLAYARSFDPTQGAQGSVIGSFLAILGVTMIFVTNLHHMMIGAAIDSYLLFPMNAAIPIEDLASIAVDTVAGSFVVGIQMSAPFIVYGLTFYLAIGVLSKLIPQVQIFFVAMPANIVAGFLIMTLLLSTIMMWFIEYFEEFVMQFVQSGS
jgi:flagellar biosynthesis protein FliR